MRLRRLRALLQRQLQFAGATIAPDASTYGSTPEDTVDFGNDFDGTARTGDMPVTGAENGRGFGVPF